MIPQAEDYRQTKLSGQRDSKFLAAQRGDPGQSHMQSAELHEAVPHTGAMHLKNKFRASNESP